MLALLPFTFGLIYSAASSRLTSPLSRSLRLIKFAATISLVVGTLGCNESNAQKSNSNNEAARITNIAIGTTVTRNEVKRLGINIPGQTFYDSGQILRNLVSRNPGFEGTLWQSILQCKKVTATSCTDGNQWAQWPANFLKDAQFEFISGVAEGLTGTVISSGPANWRENDSGVTINYAQLSKSSASGDFLVVRKTIRGNAQSGWWTNTGGGGMISTEFSDLASNSPGKQALRITAAGAGQSAEVSAYFDYSSGHSFVHLNGIYRLRFRAKSIGGNQQVRIILQRQATTGRVFLSKTVSLSDQWHDYSYDFSASESGIIDGSVALKFMISGANILLDDVSLTPAAASDTNPTAFRDEVVNTLKILHPGVLRWNDGANTGNSVDNVIADPFARLRAGASTQSLEGEDVAIGLHEFLQLCQTVGAEPYYVMPPGISTAEMKNLIEYLGGSPSTPYGAKRAARGQHAPWTTVFPIIHLELGNEEWNRGFPGAAMPDPTAYGRHAKEIFAAARQSSAFIPDKFDLIIGSFFLMPELTKQELASSSGYDSTAVAPYFFGPLNDGSSDEAIFGPLFAQPEIIDSLPSGLMAKQAKVAKDAQHPANLVVYEVNIGAGGGSAQQSSFDAVVPSVAAGIAVAEHMLLMVRDLGVKTQAIWALTGYQFRFKNSSDGKDETAPLYGVVIDMGGETNLRRPQFLAEELANRAILPAMLTTTLTGANPTWNQKANANNTLENDSAHYLQTFAFSDGPNRSVIVFNLSRTESLPITFSGSGAPSGNVQLSQLTSKKITDSNESMNNVAIVDATLNDFNPTTPYSLPPFSMTIFRWAATR